MDYLRVRWGLYKTRVVFLEYYETNMPQAPASAALHEKKTTLNSLKPITLSAEYIRSGKSFLRYGPVLAIGDSQGEIAVGSCTHRSKETALSKTEKLTEKVLGIHIHISRNTKRILKRT